MLIDPRDRELAKMLISHSTRTKAGELVFILANGFETVGLGLACAEEAERVGAAAFLQITDSAITRRLIEGGSEQVFKRLARFELKQMKDADVFIGLRGPANSFELAGVDKSKLDLYSKIVVKPVHLEERVKRTRWVVLRYPNPAMAQMAQMSTEAFADYYYRVCNVDYAHMDRAVQPLKKLMERTDKVRIQGPGTDISFSIKGIAAIPCSGTCNVPDGECFTAPVRKSVNGTVQFNTPTLNEGVGYENIRLTFKDGRVVEAIAASAEQTQRLNEVLDRDPGSRYLGEFAIAFNPQVTTPIRDILFDEKIAGSFHMALGQAYEDADNGNRSQLHWDLVCIQRPDCGGGTIAFDGKVIRKNGKFVVKELEGLNPENFAKSARVSAPKRKK